jgi:hypothetical protein
VIRITLETKYRIVLKIGLPPVLQFRNPLVMRMQSSFGKGLLLALLGFLGCLIVQGDLRPPVVTGETADSSCGVRSGGQIAALGLTGSDCKLTDRVEIGVADDDVVFEEDAVELCRVDIRERTFGIGHGAIGPRFASGIARDTRLGISLPLLV